MTWYGGASWDYSDTADIYTFATPTVMPEPFSMAFMRTAFVGVVAARLPKRRKQQRRKSDA